MSALTEAFENVTIYSEKYDLNLSLNDITDELDRANYSMKRYIGDKSNAKYIERLATFIDELEVLQQDVWKEIFKSMSANNQMPNLI